MPINFTESKYSRKARLFLAKNPKDFKFFTLLDGAVRSAKTVSIIFKLPQIFDYIGNDHLKVFSGYSKSTVRNNVLIELKPYLENYHKAVWKYNNQSGELDIKLWGKLYNCLVVGGGNAGSDSSIQGGTWDFWYANELPKHHYSFYNMALSRLSAERAMVFADSNPESQNHWLYAEKIKPYFENDPIVKEVFEYWHFKMSDNANLSREYVENQEKLYRGAFYDRKILGNWRCAEGLVYDTFSEEKHVIPHGEILEKIEKREFVEYIAGLDYGWTDPTACLIFGVTRDFKYYLIDELYSPHQQVENIQSWLSAKQTQYGFFVKYIYADNARPESNEKLKKLGSGWIVRSDKPRIADSVDTVRQIINYDKLIVSNTCRESLNELSTYRYPSEDDRIRKIYRDSEPIDEFNHSMDAMRYCLHNYDRRYNRQNLVRQIDKGKKVK